VSDGIHLFEHRLRSRQLDALFPQGSHRAWIELSTTRRAAQHSCPSLGRQRREPFLGDHLGYRVAVHRVMRADPDRPGSER